MKTLLNLLLFSAFGLLFGSFVLLGFEKTAMFKAQYQIDAGFDSKSEVAGRHTIVDPKTADLLNGTTLYFAIYEYTSSPTARSIKAKVVDLKNELKQSETYHLATSKLREWRAALSV